MYTTTIRSKRHLISLKDLPESEMMEIIDRGVEHAHGLVELGHQLRGQVIGIYFIKTSTRTRTSFSTAALRLGADIISYGPNDLQLNTGESIEDTMHVLSRMLDGLVARTAGDPSFLWSSARQQRMSIVNAMTADEHPTQALADMTTLKCHFGALSGLHLTYLGEGNNTAVALARCIAKLPKMKISFFTPQGYGLNRSFLEEVQEQARLKGTRIEEYHDLKNLPDSTDVIYTTRWQTTGTTKPDPDWRTTFDPYQVSQTLMDRYPQATFMHDLPAHRGEEVEAAVIDGRSSIAFDQAENKAHSAKAVLEWCMT